MNCNQVTELLPLYVGSDLGESRAKLVTEHVRSCEKCDSSAAKYRESRRMLQEFAPPPSSEDVYAGIREYVLNEIAKESPPVRRPSLVETVFLPRLRWAVLSTLLVTAVFFSYYFIGERPTIDRQIAVAPATGLAIPEDEQSDEISRSGEPSSSPNYDNAKPGTERGAANIHRSRRKKRVEKVTGRRRSAHVPDTITARIAPERNVLPMRDPVTRLTTVRMEMQTSDPNIRIIWFTPQHTKPDSN